MKAYTATTDNITVTVQPVFLDGQSNPLARRFVFAYFVRIENGSDEEVQLLQRHWLIMDGNGEAKEVRGEGVVGQQPTIAPGASHEYNSFSILETFEGSMEGSYRMARPSGEQFDVAIPRFTLRAAAN
jgi:ApaG protein